MSTDDSNGGTTTGAPAGSPPVGSTLALLEAGGIAAAAASVGSVLLIAQSKVPMPAKRNKCDHKQAEAQLCLSLLDLRKRGNVALPEEQRSRGMSMSGRARGGANRRRRASQFEAK